MEKNKPTLSTAQIISKNVSAYRFMLGLDYNRFAERAHLTPERVRDIEKGIDVLKNGIELLRIAEACNVSYDELFEDAESGVSRLKLNATFPEVVYQNIFKMIAKYPSYTALAKMISVHPSAVSLWLKGKAKPGPTAFQNIITVLKLKSYDLEAMVNSSKKVAEPQLKLTQESTIKACPTVTIEPEKTMQVTEPADDFESKVVKIMRLQKELPSLVDRLNEMQHEIETLKNELSKLV